MKSTTLKIKTLSLFTAIALFIGIGMVFGFKPFSDASSKPLTGFQNAEFNYSGTDVQSTSLLTPGNWSLSDGAEDCEEGNLPCVVAPDDPSITNKSELISHLQSLSPAQLDDFMEEKTIKFRD